MNQWKETLCLYEGDVVEYWFEELFFKDLVEGLVAFDKENACFHIQHESAQMSFHEIDISFSEIEIIGNIYENPELLGG